MRAETIIREWLNRRARVPELGERHTLCDWVQDDEAPMVDMARYGELLTLLPDRIVTSLEKARAARDGRIPMLKAGLGYEECLASIIVDGTAVTAAAQTFITPANLLPANYLQPGGIPGRTLKILARGRVSTTAAANTIVFTVGAKTTNAVPTTTERWAFSGAIINDAVGAQTATQWVMECGATVRSVGSAGTVYAQGDVAYAPMKIGTAAENALRFMGSAGSATPAAATVDMTVAQFLSTSITWSTTGQSLQCHRYMLEALN